MYCWNCGKEMEDDLLFCPHCAMKQAGVPEPEPKPKRKMPVLPIACGAVCLIVLLVLTLILAVPNLRPPKPTEPVDPYSVALPDLAAFLNTQYIRDDVSAYTHHVTCTLKKEEGLSGAREFAALLQEGPYQLVLDETRSSTEDKTDLTDYLFHYTGRGEGIKWVHHKEGYKYHVKLSVYEHISKDKVTIIYYSSPGFQLEDPGVDASIVK